MFCWNVTIHIAKILLHAIDVTFVVVANVYYHSST